MPPDTKDPQALEVDTTNFAPVADHLLKLLKFLTANPERKISAFSTRDRNWLTLGIHNGQLELTMTLPNGASVAKVLGPKDRSIIFDTTILHTRDQLQPSEPIINAADKQALSVNLDAAMRGMAEDTRVRAQLVDRERNKPAITAKAKNLALSLKEPARKTSVQCPNKKTIIFRGVIVSNPKSYLYRNLQELIRETGVQFQNTGIIPAENLARFTMESLLKEAAAALPEFAEIIGKFKDQVMSTKETFFKISIIQLENSSGWIIKFEIVK